MQDTSEQSILIKLHVKETSSKVHHKLYPTIHLIIFPPCSFYSSFHAHHYIFRSLAFALFLP